VPTQDVSREVRSPLWRAAMQRRLRISPAFQPDGATRPHHFSSYLIAASLSICRPSGNSSGRGSAPSMPTGVHIFWNGDHSGPIRRGGFAFVRPFGQENEWNQGEDHHGHILKHPDQRHHGGLAFHQPK